MDSILLNFKKSYNLKKNIIVLCDLILLQDLMLNPSFVEKSNHLARAG